MKSVFDYRLKFRDKLANLHLLRGQILFAFVILLGSLILTTIMVFVSNSEIENAAQKEFQLECKEVNRYITDRLQAHGQLLRGRASLFYGSDSISRAEWKLMYNKQLIKENFPGIQGVGYSIIIQPNNLAKHEESIRKEGFPEYYVKPQGVRTVYTSIVYLEPFSGRNLRAFGYDMFSEPVRREAMQRARDYNIEAISGKITLVQETNKDLQAGTLMYCPVYKKNMPIETVEERRRAIQGWVYSPYRMNDLMKGILGGYENVTWKNIKLEIFDDSSYSPNSILYSSHNKDENKSETTSIFDFKTAVSFKGHQWFLIYTQNKSKSAKIDYTLSWNIGIGGLSVSILLFVLYLLLITTKVRAIKIAEDLTSEIKANEIRHNAMISNINDVIGIMGINGIMKYKSPNIEKWFGWKPSELIGLDGRSTVHPDDLERIEKEFMSLLGRDYSTGTMSYRYKCKDGSYKPIEITAINMINDPIINGILLNYRDISERILAEEKKHQNIQLTNLNAAKDKFFSIIAHDLRSPFQGFIGLTKELSQNMDSYNKDELSNALGMLYNSANNLYSLLQNLLEWARLQQGSASFNPVQLQLSEVISRNIELLNKSAEQKKLNIIVEGSNSYTVYADSAMIDSLVRNLLSNAIKFSTPLGAIVVKSKKIDNGMIQVSFADSGIGMPESLLQKLFVIGEKVGRKGTKGEQSTGMGLLLCKEFVEKNGGKIWVESEEGKGSTFYFTLPECMN